VLAFNAAPAGFVVPNDYVAAYVARDPARLVGFGSVDPSSPTAIDELERMRADLGLVGCKLGPVYQDLDPLGPEFLRVCEALERLELPLLIHQGTTFARAGSLLRARPILLDEIALRFPELRIVIAHMGHPWFEEAIAVVRRHPHVYADVSALVSRRWLLYNALVQAIEYRVEHKLLFGTDFPFFTARGTIDGLRSVTGEAFGPKLPVVDPDVVEAIIHRPSLELLGIDT
jgi:predicted TIM-barrel fold metal-dependent hydrolase